MEKTILAKGRMGYVRFSQELPNGSGIVVINRNFSTEELTLNLQLNTSPTSLDDIIHGIGPLLPTIEAALLELGFSGEILTGERS